ncbi:MAG: DNA adenine methylase [Acidobacteria bacterium]|nr:DNA adenine methylase [Acidobacteriota bacterium]
MRTSLKVINVASVPQRSPFRYPGGKTWLVPYVRQWLSAKREKPEEFIEPFAGGAIVSLTIAFERLAESVMLIEKDEDVAAVWHTIFNARYGKWLADRIAEFEFTPDRVRVELDTPRYRLSLRERAFKTILRNRVQRGGILAAGAGVMKEGENGRGMASRWYPETLRKRILAILEVKPWIRFEQGDGIEAIRDNADRPEVAFFVDPPYTVAGRRLYTYNQINHQELFDILAGARGDFLMTYDDAKEIRQLAARHRFDTELVPMKSTHHAQMTELLIGRDLMWLRAPGRNAELAAQGALQICLDLPGVRR